MNLVYPNRITYLDDQKVMWALPNGTPFNNNNSDIGRAVVFPNNEKYKDIKFGNYTVSSCGKYLLRSELLEVMDEADIIPIQSANVMTGYSLSGEGSVCPIDIYERNKEHLDKFFQFSLYDPEYAQYVYDTVRSINNSLTYDSDSKMQVSSAIGKPMVRFHVSDPNDRVEIRSELKEQGIEHKCKKNNIYLEDTFQVDVLVLSDRVRVNMATLSVNYDNTEVLKYVNESLNTEVEFKTYEQFILDKHK